MNKTESFCKLLWGWTKARSMETSTLRGVILAGAGVAAAINPALGVAVAKVAAVLVGGIDIFTIESKPK